MLFLFAVDFTVAVQGWILKAKNMHVTIECIDWRDI